MHLLMHIVEDSMKVLKRTRGTRKNRTTTDSVLKWCRDNDIHGDLTSPGMIHPKWTLTGDEEIEVQKTMQDKPSGVPWTMQYPIQYNGGFYTHDKIMWAANYAEECLRGKGDEHVTNNILELFDMVKTAIQFEFSKKELKESIIPRLIEVLVDHEGLLPPTGSSESLQKLQHVYN